MYDMSPEPGDLFAPLRSQLSYKCISLCKS